MTAAQIPLGASGLEVSRLGLGTVKFGRTESVKYPTPVTLPTDDEARYLLHEASEMGINLIDTAPAYGSSEERLGALLHGQRDRWVLCTKVGETFENGVSRFDFSADATRASVLRSLDRLRTDVLDIVLIHSDGSDADILQHSGALETLFALKQEGRVRAVGISHKTAEGALLALSLGVDVVMATLNRQYTAELDVIRQAAEQGVGVLIKKALASGHARPEDLAFVAEQTGVHSIVVGTTNPAHLRANADAIS